MSVGRLHCYPSPASAPMWRQRSPINVSRMRPLALSGLRAHQGIAQAPPCQRLELARVVRTEQGQVLLAQGQLAQAILEGLVPAVLAGRPACASCMAHADGARVHEKGLPRGSPLDDPLVFRNQPCWLPRPCWSCWSWRSCCCCCWFWFRPCWLSCCC